MNKIIQSLLNEVIRVEISGKKLMNGTVIDLGSDMVVLYNGKDFVYIPLVHIQNIEGDLNNEGDINDPTVLPNIITEKNNVDLSFEKILTEAKGKYIEIYVTGGQSLHGSIISIMNNYFVFHSPVYKTMYIALNHLKWIIPYSTNERLYDLDDHDIRLQSNNVRVEKNFGDQVKKIKNEIVVLNIGGSKSYIGKVNNVEDQIVEFQTARTHPVFLNLQHIKTLHLV